MILDLTLKQITELSTKEYIEIQLDDPILNIYGDDLKVNSYVSIMYRDIELDGLVKKISSSPNGLTVKIERVDTGLKEEWFSCVRSLNKVDVQESNLLIHLLLDKLCEQNKWEDIDELIKLIRPETENLDIILSFLVCTARGKAPKKLRKRKWLYNSSYSRLKEVIKTYGVLENLRCDY